MPKKVSQKCVVRRRLQTTDAATNGKKLHYKLDWRVVTTNQVSKYYVNKQYFYTNTSDNSIVIVEDLKLNAEELTVTVSFWKCPKNKRLQ